MPLSQERIAQIQAQLQGLSPEEQQQKIQELLSPEELEELRKQQCPFCMIVAGKIPAKKIYEDDLVEAVLDINPANKGHVIVYPKNHYQFLFLMPDNEVARLFQVANKISKVVFELVGAQGTNIFLANGQVAGQTSPHVLVHVIPRFQDDGISFAWQSKKIDQAEMDAIADQLISKKIQVGETKQVIEEVPIEVEDDMPEPERIP